MFCVNMIQVIFLNFENLFASMKTTSQFYLLTAVNLLLILKSLATNLTLYYLMSFGQVISKLVIFNKKLVANHTWNFLLLMNSFYMSV